MVGLTKREIPAKQGSGATVEHTLSATASNDKASISTVNAKVGAFGSCAQGLEQRENVRWTTEARGCPVFPGPIAIPVNVGAFDGRTDRWLTGDVVRLLYLVIYCAWITRNP